MTRRSRTVLIHPSFRAEAMRDRRLGSLRTSRIDPALHYVGVRQADMWLNVHQVHAPGSVDPDFERIYRDLADDAARALDGQSVHVIGLGAGGGEKEAWVLQALQHRNCRLRYTPVDISPELALQSAEMAESLVDCPVYPTVGDLSMLTAVQDWLTEPDSAAPRVYTAFGLTPNFAPSTLFGMLRSVLRPQDLLLISANLAPVVDDDEADYRQACYSVMGQYDNPETLRWLNELLVEWGIAAMLSEPVFGLDDMEGIGGFFATSRWRSDATVELDGGTFPVTEGSPLRLFFSLRYTPRRIQDKLSEYGLRIDHGHMARNGQEGVYLARVSS